MLQLKKPAYHIQSRHLVRGSDILRADLRLKTVWPRQVSNGYCPRLNDPKRERSHFPAEALDQRWVQRLHPEVSCVPPPGQVRRLRSVLQPLSQIAV